MLAKVATGRVIKESPESCVETCHPLRMRLGMRNVAGVYGRRSGRGSLGVRKAFRVAVSRMAFAGPLLAACLVAAPVHAEQREGENLVPQPMREKQFPVGVSFTVLSINGRAFPGENPAMTLDTTFRLRGFGGCNNYSAIAYPQPEQGIAVGPFALTNRECERQVMQSERAFLEALRAAQKWDTQGNRLTLEGPRGSLELERAM